MYFDRDDVCEFQLSILAFLWQALHNYSAAQSLVQRVFEQTAAEARSRGWVGKRHIADGIPSEHLPSAELENDAKIRSHSAGLREFQVSILAYCWRGLADNPEAESIAAQVYGEVLEAMHARGWTTFLDVDSELPDQYLPQWYLNQR